MSFLDRVGREISVGDFLVYVTAGDRHPVLEFGYVLKFHESKDWQGKPSGNVKIKFQRAEPNGKRRNVTAVDIAAHWSPATPQPFIDYDKAAYGERDKIMTSEEFWAGRKVWWINNTYKDTGKPDTTMLDLIETKDPNAPHHNNRMMIVQPV